MNLGRDVSGPEFWALFERFENAIGKSLWHKRVRDIRSEIRGNSYLKDYLLLENRIVLVLADYSAHMEKTRIAPAINIQDPAQYEAVSLVTQFVRLTESADEATVRKLEGRMRGCIKNPSDLNAFAFELETAAELQRRGSIVHQPQGGSYDWLAERDGLSFEVECKLISYEKGRQVHFRAALVTSHLVKQAIGKMLDGLSNGLLVRITVPGRYPDSFRDRQQIAQLARQAIVSAGDIESPFARISLRNFDAKPFYESGNRWQIGDVKKFLESQFGIRRQHAIALGTRNKGVLLIVNESGTRDDLVGETMSTLRDAARNQLSGTRPGVLCVRLEATTLAELNEIAAEADGKPSLMRLRVNKLFESSALKNVVWIIFSANGNVEAHSEGTYSLINGAYGFWNPISPIRDDPRLRLYGLSKQLRQVIR